MNENKVVAKIAKFFGERDERYADDPTHGKDMQELDASRLYHDIIGEIEANAYERSARRMDQLEEYDPGGTISIAQAAEYLRDAAAVSRKRT